MEESFLHFIWKFQQIESRNLSTDSGANVTVLHPGFHNTDAGPDFKNAKIKIGDIVWNGNVEIHVNAKDWNAHKHQDDEAYNNVVLHVVWKNDASAHRKDQTVIPALELRSVVDKTLILNFKKLFEPGNEILCNQFIGNIKPITILNMMDKALSQRLEEKSQMIFREIALTDNDWEEIAWRMLCRNFGFKTNAHPFYDLGKSMPLKTLKKESYDVKTIEALLFGQAGFLEEALEDDYFKTLKKEYNFKKSKYDLDRRIDKHQWKFLRLRPANFPTIRIAQLASLIANNINLFSALVKYPNIKDLRIGLQTTQSTYWQLHYDFGTEAKTKIGSLGASSVENILINTVAPLQFAYGIHKDLEELKEKALALLTSVKSAKNSITKKWSNLGVQISSSFDSQALLELYTQYCKKKRCLCAIGVEIVSTS